MRKRYGYWLAAAVLAAVLAVGCDDDDDDGGAAGVAGTWSGGGRYDYGVEIQNMTLNLTQTDVPLAGTYTWDRGGRGNMSGSVSGSAGNGEIDIAMSPHGKAYGTYGGNTMHLRWYESGFDVVGGWGSVTLTR